MTTSGSRSAWGSTSSVVLVVCAAHHFNSPECTSKNLAPAAMKACMTCMNTYSRPAILHCPSVGSFVPVPSFRGASFDRTIAARAIRSRFFEAPLGPRTTCPKSQPPTTKTNASNRSPLHSRPAGRPKFPLSCAFFARINIGIEGMKTPRSIAHDRLAPFIVVTGAGRGVGFETARSLASDYGADVLAISRDLSSWSIGDHPRMINVLSADLTTEDGRAAVVRAVGERPLDGLLNNAGILLKRDLGDWVEQDLFQLFGSNTVAPLLLTQALLPALGRSRASHVVNVSSMGGFQGSAKFAGLIGYSASKAALACVTECLAEELKETHVRCNCLCLGAVDTAMLREAFPGYHAQVSAAVMGRFIAEFILNGHKLLNGKVLPVSLSTP